MERLRYLVVILPGIGGSVLEAPDGTVVWGEGKRALARTAIRPERLSLADSPDLRPVTLIPRTCLVGWTVIHGYDALVRKIRNAFSGVRVEVARPGADRSAAADVLLVPYDFRRPARESAERLAAEVSARLEPLTEEESKHRVIVIAHSMGGLVARYWLGSLGGADCCRALITVGTPHRGAPKALDWLVNGMQAGPLTLQHATAVLRDWPSTYDLLPRYQAVLRDAGQPANGSVYPHELGALLQNGALPLDFAARAAESYKTHLEIEEAWAQLIAEGRGPNVIPLFARGHATPSRAVVMKGRLAVTKKDPEWLPNEDWLGDGTVPAIAALPIELSDNPIGWQAVTERHQPMATCARIVDILRNLNGESLAAVRGAARPDRPWLGLDLDDLIPARQPFPVAAQLLGAEPAVASAVWASVTAADDLAGNPRQYEMEYVGGWWRAEVPALADGMYQVKVEAVGVPGADRVTCSDAVGVVGE
jgi:pimeloyl-ACP methyl ester carboxylesterase